MMTTTRTTHRIIAAPWQLGRSLELILLPLVPEPLNYELMDCWLWRAGVDDYVDFTAESQGKLLKRLPYQKGDRLFLAEKWNQPNSTSLAVAKSRACPGSVAERIWRWQPASTMPPEAAVHWYAIADVRVCQCKDLGMPEFLQSGLAKVPLAPYSVMRKQWDDAHPDYPWFGDRQVVVLAVEAIGEIQ